MPRTFHFTKWPSHRETESEEALEGAQHGQQGHIEMGEWMWHCGVSETLAEGVWATKFTPALGSWCFQGSVTLETGHMEGLDLRDGGVPQNSKHCHLSCVT